MGEEVSPIVFGEGERTVRRVNGVELLSERFSAVESLLLTDRRPIFIYRGKVEMAGATIPQEIW